MFAPLAHPCSRTVSIGRGRNVDRNGRLCELAIAVRTKSRRDGRVHELRLAPDTLRLFANYGRGEATLNIVFSGAEKEIDGQSGPSALGHHVRDR